MQGPWLWKSSSQVEFCLKKRDGRQEVNNSPVQTCTKQVVKTYLLSLMNVLHPVHCFLCFTHFASYFTQLKKNKKELKIIKKKNERPDETHTNTQGTRFSRISSRTNSKCDISIFTFCSGPNEFLSWVVNYEINFFTETTNK